MSEPATPTEARERPSEPCPEVTDGCHYFVCSWCESVLDINPASERWPATRPAEATQGPDPLRVSADYPFHCHRCGAAHNCDTSIPSEQWNQITADIGGRAIMLCTLCIDELLVEHGLTAEAHISFVGAALRTEPGMPAEATQGEDAQADRLTATCCDGKEHVVTVRWPTPGSIDEGVEFSTEPRCEGPESWAPGCELLDDSYNYHIMVGRFAERRNIVALIASEREAAAEAGRREERMTLMREKVSGDEELERLEREG